MAGRAAPPKRPARRPPPMQEAQLRRRRRPAAPAEKAQAWVGRAATPTPAAQQSLQARAARHHRRLQSEAPVAPAPTMVTSSMAQRAATLARAAWRRLALARLPRRRPQWAAQAAIAGTIMIVAGRAAQAEAPSRAATRPPAPRGCDVVCKRNRWQWGSRLKLFIIRHGRRGLGRRPLGQWAVPKAATSSFRQRQWAASAVTQSLIASFPPTVARAAGPAP